MPRDWSTADVAIIREVARQGGSFSDAAERLGPDVNRNMVAGKAHREGIAFHGQQGERGREKAAATRRRTWASRPAEARRQQVAAANAARRGQREGAPA